MGTRSWPTILPTSHHCPSKLRLSECYFVLPLRYSTVLVWSQSRSQGQTLTSPGLWAHFFMQYVLYIFSEENIYWIFSMFSRCSLREYLENILYVQLMFNTCSPREYFILQAVSEFAFNSKSKSNSESDFYLAPMWSFGHVDMWSFGVAELRRYTGTKCGTFQNVEFPRSSLMTQVV